MAEDLLTIRQMCDAYEVTPRTLRFYEAKELLAPVREGQRRWFTRRDQARLKLILRGKRFGLPLEEIRQLLDLYDGGDGAMVQVARAHEIGQGRLAEMMLQREELDAAIKDLERQLRWGEEAMAGAGRRKAG